MIAADSRRRRVVSSIRALGAVLASGFALPMATAPILIGATAVVVSGCNKTEEKKIPKEESKASAVPSDMVYNDFLPQSGSAEGLAVRVDGGYLDAGAHPADDSGAPAAAEPQGSTIKLLEPGAEPRTAHKYTFAVGRVDKRVVTIRQSAAMQGQAMDQPGLVMTVAFTPKEAEPSGTRFEMTLAKIDLADKAKLDPRMVQAASQQFGMFAGLTASFTVTSHGELGELSLAGSPQMQQEGAEVILDGFQQIAEIVFAPLPSEPIGVGAKWERDEVPAGQGAKAAGETSKRSFELTELGPTGAKLVAKLERHVAKRPYPDPRMRGATVEVLASGTYTYVTAFDHVASHISGEQVQKVTIEVPNPNGSGEKKTMKQDVKITHLLESPTK